MPRPPRLLLSHSYYHIMARGNNRHWIFKNNSDYQYYIELINRFKTELPFDLYHYCLMPNHIHFLVKIQNAHNFSNFMKKLSLAYFYHYKELYSWVGHLWQDRFKSQPVGKDEYFIQCGKYIELNPVRKNLVEKPEEYPFSSYQYYAFGKNNILLTEDLFYSDLGKSKITRQKNYQNLIIGDLVKESYAKKVWASKPQSNNEKVKINYHLKH